MRVVIRRLMLAGAVAMALPVAAQARGPVVTSIIDAGSPIAPGEYAWDDNGVPSGPVRIVVDLATEKLHVYRGGVEIGQAFILYGADHKPTPTGTFPILQKDKDHVSNLYGAPMPYMLRLTWGGVAIHGSEVEANAATHGCVGVPDEFAALLFAQAKKGDPVLVTRNWRPDLYRAQPAVTAPEAVEAPEAETVAPEEPVTP